MLANLGVYHHVTFQGESVCKDLFATSTHMHLLHVHCGVHIPTRGSPETSDAMCIVAGEHLMVTFNVMFDSGTRVVSEDFADETIEFANNDIAAGRPHLNTFHLQLNIKTCRSNTFENNTGMS